jgi:hypothetical protein
MTRLLYWSASFGLFSNFALAAILVSGTLATHSSKLHAAWLGAIILVSLARLGINLRFARAKPAQKELVRWRWAFAWGGGAVAGPDLGRRGLVLFR